MAAGSPVSQRNGRATTTRPGTVTQATATANVAGADVAALRTEINAFLATLRTAGIIAP